MTKDELYLHVAAGSVLWGWIVVALTAASPLADSSLFLLGGGGGDVFAGRNIFHGATGMAESYDITAASAQDKGNEMDLFTVATAEEGLTNAEIAAQLEKSIEGRALSKVLIIPPDFTRYHSNAGYITCEYYKLLAARGATVDVMPALGLWINREKFTA